MRYNEIRQKLISMAEAGYKRFSEKLLPGTGNILGVRLPALRSFAKEIVRTQENPCRMALEYPCEFFEETMLCAMILSYAGLPPEEMLCAIAQFIPKIDNWSVCDSFCAGLKFVKNCQSLVWSWLEPLCTTPGEFSLRFALVTMLLYFITDCYISDVLIRIDNAPYCAYYDKMAAAWAISICYAKFPEATVSYLNNDKLDKFTHNKAIQKITELKGITPEERMYIRSLKR